MCLFVLEGVANSSLSKKEAKVSRQLFLGNLFPSARYSDLILPCEYPFESDINNYSQKVKIPLDPPLPVYDRKRITKGG